LRSALLVVRPGLRLGLTARVTAPLFPSSSSLVTKYEVRQLSIFSNIFGPRKSLEERKEKVEGEKPSSLPKQTSLERVKSRSRRDRLSRKKVSSEVDETVGEPAEKLALSIKSRKERKARLRKVREDRLDDERIIGGSYPVRGPAIPKKRLREWVYKVENMQVSPKKLNLIARLIRKLPVEEARLQLRFSKKAISQEVLYALDKACLKARKVANMHTQDLIVGQCYVGSKIVGHKLDIKARGKSGRITKKVAHLNMILYENPALVKGFQSSILYPGTYRKWLNRDVPKTKKMKSSDYYRSIGQRSSSSSSVNGAKTMSTH